MPSHPEHELDPRLLDLHLGLLSEQQRLDLLAIVEADADLRAQHEALTVMFDALDVSRCDVGRRRILARFRIGERPRGLRPAAPHEF